MRKPYKKPDWGEMRLKPLIKKVCAKTEAAYYLEAKPESVFIWKTI